MTQLVSDLSTKFDEKMYLALTEQDKMWEQKHSQTQQTLEDQINQQQSQIKALQMLYRKSCCVSQAFAMFPEHSMDKDRVKQLAETIAVYPEYMFDK